MPSKIRITQLKIHQFEKNILPEVARRHAVSSIRISERETF